MMTSCQQDREAGGGTGPEQIADGFDDFEKVFAIVAADFAKCGKLLA